ncbi:succinylglutamate desuccinylase/aspartoacylase family protein [Methylobacillus gramineus]|uniref:succinylglutamate desuccinylase/aspartoacylase domain-containing protein n=1 Tax=Methylobacillus gramineus TaxID=755169 RepID=UPI001CFF576D|nr:succinylglutamate desuccinylase/aspartoacylase family protein [Methylobacillus gramineus]MCB5184339.1 succinylglutamate desuccinylase/aspartoacylase family protein [Methylobacillus gramineus]
MSHAERYHFQSISFSGLQSGKRLIVLGGVHGNEPCGTQAIRRIVKQLEDGDIAISHGTVTFVPVTNPKAAHYYRRSGDRNLNRHLQPTADPAEFEDHVANWLCPLLSAHEVLLDLHSFHTDGQPFAMLGPKNNQGALEPFKFDAEEESLARRLGVNRFVDGWLDTYAIGVKRRLQQAVEQPVGNSSNSDACYGIGTTEYMRSQGGYGLTLECGQHEDPAAPEIAYQAILNTLAWLGCIDAPTPDEVPERETLRLFEVVDRIDAGDRLAKNWASFDQLQAGELIGTRANGEQLLAQEAGYIVFPNPNAEPGNEWFYLAKSTSRV